jgi:two-component system, LytTR family, response regulator LytT
MKILIIEDEDLAVRKLQKTLATVAPEAIVAGITSSIRSTVSWLENNPAPDLILMDIELADGQSFEIFEKTEVTSPVIFTTSYDEFAMRAFKVNSVDYLLKPVQKEELHASLEKYRNLSKHYTSSVEPQVENLIRELQQHLQPKEFRKRFLVKHANRMISVEVNDIAYFFSDNGLNFFMSTDGRKYLVDYLMDEIEAMVDPDRFFRVSRSLIVTFSSIEKMEDYFGNRIIMKLNPDSEKEALVSREKVQDFKKWMGK